MASPAEGLRKILALERDKKYADAAVVGGLDRFLLRFATDNALPQAHPVSRVLHSLPPGGYRALHKIQRRRVIEELEKAAADIAAPATTTPSTKPVARPAPVPPARKATTPPPAPAATPRTPTTLGSPISALGLRRPDGQRLVRLGLNTVRDLLFHFPARYRDYSEARPISKLEFGEEQTVIGNVWTSVERQIGRQRRKATEVVINDNTGTLRIVWWNQPWVARRFRPGMRVALSGKVTEFGGRLQMDSPEIEQVDDESLQRRRLVPVYPSTEGLNQQVLRETVLAAIQEHAKDVTETLPEEMLRRHGLPGITGALLQVHQPDSHEEKEQALRRFSFEELLYLQVGVVRRRIDAQSTAAPRLVLPEAARHGYVASLPFSLTADQETTITEILADIADETSMTRLLEGEVGSGKTVVAGAALLAAVVSGYQGAIMAPTEILAEQHFRTFLGIFDPEAVVVHEDARLLQFEHRAPGYVPLHPAYLDRPLGVALLTGSLKPSEKAKSLKAIESGEVDIVVGTHALIQQGVAFQRLGLAVVDEQHRFGVEQRSILREKGGSPHVLVMTATPIPRTLALTVYGDLDISLLKEMPGNRPAVKTYRVLPYRRDEAFDLARKKIAEGRQAFVICPLVEESEAIEARAAVQEYERLSRDVFPHLRLGLLHGRMPSREKDAVMLQFRDHQIDVLVSTAVVEVGVDVPNATVILIEGADRFGLSQLHQFRGRVRRSNEHQGYCFLLSDNPTPESDERLVIMETTSDGFELAEKDLELRGAGEYFGKRQSGAPDLRFAKLTDTEEIMAAKSEAERLLATDPQLSRPEHATIANAVADLWDRVTSDVS